MCGASSMSIEKPSAPARKRRCSGPTVVPATSTSSPSRADDDAHEVRVVLRGGKALLGDVDPAFGGDQRRVHLVHGLVDPTLERAVQRSDRQESRVVLRERAVDGDRDARRPRARERHRESAELRRERDERAEDLELARIDDRDVDRRPDDLSVERRGNLLRDHDTGSILRLGRRAGEVRRHDDLRELEQRARVRLRLEDVERCAGDLARLPIAATSASSSTRPPLRRIDDPYTVLHLLEGRRVEEPSCLVVQREMKRDDVGLGVDLLERAGRFDTELAEPIGGHERVVRDDAHPQPERAMRDLAADPSQPEHAERLPRQLDSREARPIPGSGRERGVRLGDVPGEREEERDRMLGSGVDGRLGGVRDDDAAAGRRLDVDVVHADACPSDDLEAVCMRSMRDASIVVAERMTIAS